MLTKDYALSFLEQVLVVYLSSFFGLLLTSWTGEISMSAVTAAAVAAAPAAIAAIKAGIAKFIGDPNSANFK